jgi:hypothetical protein
VKVARVIFMFKGGGMGGVNSLSSSTNHPSRQEVQILVMLEVKGGRFGA